MIWLIDSSLYTPSTPPTAESATSSVRPAGSGTWIGSCLGTRPILRLSPWCLTIFPGPTCSATSPWTTLLLQGRRLRPEGVGPAGAQRVRSSGASLSREQTAGRGWSHCLPVSGRRCVAGSFRWSLPADWRKGMTDCWSLGSDWPEESAFEQDHLHMEFRNGTTV